MSWCSWQDGNTKEELKTVSAQQLEFLTITSKVHVKSEALNANIHQIQIIPGLCVVTTHVSMTDEQTEGICILF